MRLFFFVAALSKGQDLASVSAVLGRVLGVGEVPGRIFMGALILLELALASALAGGVMRGTSAAMAAFLGAMFVLWNGYLKINGITDCGCGVSEAMKRLMGFSSDSMFWSITVFILSFTLLTKVSADRVQLLKIRKEEP